MIYLLIKSLHITAVVIWLSGMLLTPLMMLVLSRSTLKPSDERVDLLMRIYRRLVTPAMILAWCLGIWLVSTGGWMDATWLQVKLLLVVLISAFHGFLSGRLRLLAKGNTRVKFVLPVVAVQIIILFVISVLVIVKPA